MLPAKFVERVLRELGPDEGGALCRALTGEPSVSVRLNAAKGLAAPSGRPIGWSSGGYWLDARPSFTLDPDFHAGRYYVQEASSQFVGHIVAACGGIRGGRVLDLCAAPGGKTTLYSTLAGRGGLVVANEIVRNRAAVLADNVRKWGVGNVAVTVNDPSQVARLEGWFDAVAVDAPCSGEGMFRKDPDAIAEWSPTGVDRCAERQQQILTDVWPALKPGGVLIYSTCTYNLEENEEMVLYLMKELGATPLTVDTDPAWGIASALVPGVTAYRFMPHLTRGEGLFMAVLRKPSEPDDSHSRLLDEPAGKRNKKGKKTTPATPVPDEWCQRLARPDDFDFVSRGDSFLAIPREYRADYQLLDRHLTLLQAGVTLATVKGRDYIPHPSLALSTALDPEKTPRFEADLATALAYLRRESIVLPPDQPRGYLIVAYRGFPLGWVKNLGNRANNLYPQEWRIRSGYTPDLLPDLPVEHV